MFNENVAQRDNDFKIVCKLWSEIKFKFAAFPLVYSIFRRSLLETELSKVNPETIGGLGRSREVHIRWKKKVRMRVNIISAFSFRKLSVYFFLVRQLLIIYFSADKNKFSIISYVHRTPALEKSLERFFEKRFKHQVCWLKKPVWSVLSSFLLFISFSYRNYQSVLEKSVDDVLYPDNSELHAITKRLDLGIKFAAFFLKVLNVKIIFSHDCHSQVGMLITHAARLCDIPVVEVAHGYTQDESLLTVFPMSADYEIVWGDLLKDQIKERLLEERVFDRSGDLIRSFGQIIRGDDLTEVGARVVEEHGPVPANRVLVLVPRLFTYLDISSRTAVISEFAYLIAELERSRCSVSIRPSPFCREADLLILQRYGGIFSAIDIDSDQVVDLDRFDIVIGAMSSLLYEAAICGVRAYQLSDFPGVHIEGAIITSFHECVSDIHRSNNYPQDTVSRFRETEFRSFLSGLIYFE